MRVLRPSAVVLLLVLAISASACGEARQDVPATATPTLLIAVDGLDWQLLLPAMQEGRAPNLLDLARRGTAARLTTFEPTDSPVIWTSVATGKTMDKHGITRFAQHVGDELIPVTSNQRLARAFWNILGESRLRVGLVGWWVTWPAEPIEGWMVAPISTVAGRTWKGSIYADTPDQTWPPELLGELRESIVAAEEQAPRSMNETFPLPQGAGNWLVELRRDFGWSFTSDRIFQALAEEIARDKSPAVLAVYQGALDVAGHRFWGYTFPEDPGVPPNDVDEATAAALGRYLPSVLEVIDAMVGNLRALMPPSTDVIVVSDHGMHHRRAKGGAPGRSPLLKYNTGAHGDAPDGVWIAAGPSFRTPKPAFALPESPDQLPRLGDKEHPAVLDITPTLLHLHGLPIGRDMDGRVLTDLLVNDARSRPVAWVDTHEKGPPPARQPLPVQSPTDRDTIERLRSLGYLGDSD